MARFFITVLIVVFSSTTGLSGRAGISPGSVYGIEEPDGEEEPAQVMPDNSPTFHGGGISDFHAWVMGRIEYPQLAWREGIEGMVVVRFVVEKDGTITDIEVLRSPHEYLSEEGVRVVSSSPKWKPVKWPKKAVRVFYNLPVQFRL
ncbi:MAG: energy transducer TonB [Alistipes sp.]|nr:energy transducer TonB [Alistipes sp.]